MTERSEVPEPSSDDPMSHYTDPTDPFWQPSPEPQGEPSEDPALRVFATIVNDEAVSVADLREYAEFAWNVRQGEVEEFMNERHPDAIYAIIERSRP